MEMPNGLYEKVMQCIAYESEKRLKIRIYWSLLFVVTTSLWLYRDLISTGFIESFKLTFTDSAVIIVYWNDFVSALIEELPFMSVMACLIAVFALLKSLKKYYESSFFQPTKI